MAIDGVAVDEPFYFSSSGSTDEASIFHNGANFVITNSVGKTVFENGITANQYVFDHANTRVGINTNSPAFSIHVVDTASSDIVVEYVGGSQMSLSSGLNYGFSGTLSNHNYRLLANNSYKVEIKTNGDIMAPAAYTTLIGGTNTDLYIDSTGLIGPNPSSARFKENIREIDPEFETGIKNLKVKIADIIDGPTDILTVIAEEAAIDMPGIERYAIHEKLENQIIWPALNSSEYANLDKLEITAGVEKKVIVERIAISENGERSITPVEKIVVKLPHTVNRSDLIYPIIIELQRLIRKVEGLDI
jgi:hypothetical protein